MRHGIRFLLVIAFSLGVIEARAQVTITNEPLASDVAALKSDDDRMSYAVGMAFAHSLKQKEIAVLNFDLVLKGLGDAYGDKTPALTEAEFNKYYAAFQKRVTLNLEGLRKKVAFENLTSGKEFLARNAKNTDVSVLPDGLQYKVVKMGDGPKPGLKDKVALRYRGALTNTVEFENTLKDEKPAVLDLEQMVPAWREALQMMPVGSRWQIFVPADLAYGERGAGTVIPPNAVTLFEIELVEIVKP